MEKIPLSSGKCDGKYRLLEALLLLTSGSVTLTLFFKSHPILAALVFTANGILAIYHFRNWRAFRAKQWSLQFSNSTLQIYHKEALTFSGTARELHKLDRDGDGYTLSPAPKQLLFLAHRDCDETLSATLDTGINFETY